MPAWYYTISIGPIGLGIKEIKVLSATRIFNRLGGRNKQILFIIIQIGNY